MSQNEFDAAVRVALRSKFRRSLARGALSSPRGELMNRIIACVALTSGCILFTGQSVAAVNLVLNGSFETNGAATTQFNLPNASVGGLISNTTGFGPAE